MVNGKEIDATDALALQAEIAKMQSKLDKLKVSRKPTLKVSEKGALSMYGLNKFPVTLYKEQWVKVLDMAEDIKAFIADNNDKLVSKNE